MASLEAPSVRSEPALSRHTEDAQRAESQPANRHHSREVAALRAQVDRWMGTPYRWGGQDLNGVDCSAFVQSVVADALGVRIPRTTSEQKSVGHSVGGDLRPADLLFFRTPKRTDHVGIYLGDGQFAHASTSRGVMVSSLDERYWDRAFEMARRPVELAAPTEPTPFPRIIVASTESEREEAEAPPPARSRRSGW